MIIPPVVFSSAAFGLTRTLSSKSSKFSFAIIYIFIINIRVANVHEFLYQNFINGSDGREYCQHPCQGGSMADAEITFYVIFSSYQWDQLQNSSNYSFQNL